MGLTIDVRRNIQDKCNLEDLTYDDKIEYWHTHETGNSLREFLGMTDEQYLDFALGKDRKKRRKPKMDVREKTVGLNYESEYHRLMEELEKEKQKNEELRVQLENKQEELRYYFGFEAACELIFRGRFENGR